MELLNTFEEQKLNVEEQDQTQELKRSQIKKQEEIELAQEINKELSELDKSTGDVIGLSLTVENRRIRLGALLRKAKDLVKHGRFMKWRQKHCPLLKDTTAQRCMAYAKAANDQEITSLDGIREYNKLLVRFGHKESGKGKGHGPQKLHDHHPFLKFTGAIAKARQEIEKIFETRPVDEWDQDERDQLRAQLDYFVELHGRLE